MACVIGTPTHDATHLKYRAQRLKVTKPIVAELRQQSLAIEVEPGGLNIEHDPQLRSLFDRFQAHKVAVRDTRAHGADRERLVDLGIGVEQRMNRAVAALAQLVEHSFRKAGVACSSHASGTISDVSG